MTYPGKNIPSDYTEQSTSNFLPAEPAFAQDWHDLIEAQNYMASVQGTTYLSHVWEPVLTASPSNEQRKMQELTGCGIPRKFIDGVGYKLEFFAYGHDFKIDFKIYNASNRGNSIPGGGSDGLIKTVSLDAATTSDAWESTTTTLNLDQVSIDLLKNHNRSLLEVRPSIADSGASGGFELHTILVRDAHVTSTSNLQIGNFNIDGPAVCFVQNSDDSAYAGLVDGANLKTNTVTELGVGTSTAAACEMTGEDGMHVAIRDGSNNLDLVQLDASLSTVSTNTGLDSSIDDGPLDMTHDFASSNFDIVYAKDVGTSSGDIYHHDESTSTGLYQTSSLFVEKTPSVRLIADREGSLHLFGDMPIDDSGTNKQQKIYFKKPNGQSWESADVVETTLSGNSEASLVRPGVAVEHNNSPEFSGWPLVWLAYNDDGDSDKVIVTGDSHFENTREWGDRRVTVQTTGGLTTLSMSDGVLDLISTRDTLHLLAYEASGSTWQLEYWEASKTARDVWERTLIDDFSSLSGNSDSRMQAVMDDDRTIWVAYTKNDGNGNPRLGLAWSYWPDKFETRNWHTKTFDDSLNADSGVSIAVPRRAFK